MWPWNLIALQIVLNLLLGGAAAGTAFAANPVIITADQIGPTSDAEAALLWKDGKAEFEAHHCGASLERLTRLIARYPAHPGFTEAHRLAGICQLEARQNAPAIASFKYYVEAQGQGVQRLPAKNLLAQAYLAAGRFSETFLLTGEVLKGGTANTPLDDSTRASALLLRARALFGLGRKLQAQDALESAQALLAKSHDSDPALQAKTRRLALDFNLERCEQWVKGDHLPEADTLYQFGQRFECLERSGLLLLDLFKAAQPAEAELGRKSFKLRWQQYLDRLSNPPALLGPQSAKERQTQRTELVKKLQNDAQPKIVAWLASFKDSRKDVPGLTQPIFDQLIQDLTLAMKGRSFSGWQ